MLRLRLARGVAHDQRQVQEGQRRSSATYKGGATSDELLGHHGSDTLSGRGGSDVIWGDHDPNGQPASQNDLIFGGDGNDFIYGSHGRNVINGGARQRRDLRPLRARRSSTAGRAATSTTWRKSRKRGYKFRNCEKVDYRSERQRGGGLRPLP